MKNRVTPIIGRLSCHAHRIVMYCIVVVRGRVWSCVVVRGRSCRGYAWSCVVVRLLDRPPFWQFLAWTPSLPLSPLHSPLSWHCSLHSPPRHSHSTGSVDESWDKRSPHFTDFQSRFGRCYVYKHLRYIDQTYFC